MLKTCDANAAQLAQLELSIGARLAALAVEYAEGQRPRAALELLERASRYDESAVKAAKRRGAKALRPALAERDGLPPEASVAVIDNQQLCEYFRAPTYPFGDAVWKIDPIQGAQPPENQKGALVLGAKPDKEIRSVSLQTRPLSPDSGSRGMVFSWRSRSDYFLVQHNQRIEELAVYHYYGKNWHRLAKQRTKFSPEALAEWMTMAVSWDTESLQVQFGTSDPLKFGRPDLFRPGRVALWMSDRHGPFEFRNFALEFVDESK